MEELLALIKSGVELTQGAWSLGAVAVLAALVKIAIDFSKTQLGQKLLSKISAQHPWTRPLIATVLGLLAGALGAIALKKPWLDVLQAGFVGIAAAWSAVGAHELWSKTGKKGRAQAAVSSLIADALAGPEAEVKTKTEALKAELDRAVSTPNEHERLAAMAAFSNRHPPKAKATP